MKALDNFLNNITMYRLVLYFLILLVTVAVFFSFIGVLPYNGFALMFSVAFLLIAGLITNVVFAYIFKAPTNTESVYISALILALIIAPPKSLHDLMFLFWAAVWTMASKFMFAIGKKHIFNPVAIAVFLLSITIGASATWWVGNTPLLPFTLIGGFLIVRKIKRFDLVLSFFGASFVTIAGLSLLAGSSFFATFEKTLFYSPWFFFASIMLTEPLTTPPTRNLRIVYAAIVGILFSPQFHIGSIYTTPEMALVIGNLFSYIVSPKYKFIFKIKQKLQLSPDTYDFVFALSHKLAYSPGQYMEWTLSHKSPDDRGNRRYFTLASSPTEDNIRIGVKFHRESSSYKKSLFEATSEKEIVASQLAGDFTLPEDPGRKCVFIAGGIGVTPFRSMVKYLIDNNQKRSITVFYSNKSPRDIVYKDVFDEAQSKLGIKVVYVLTDKSSIPQNWQGKVGHIDENMIVSEVPDYKERYFYISGPRSMIDTFKAVLKKMGIDNGHIVTDYFPGFA